MCAVLVCGSRAPRARALYVPYMHPQAPGGLWASQTAISWSHIFGYGPYPPGYGFGVKNQKKVDDAVVFGLRGMHNHTHLGHVMGYIGIGDVFRWFGAFFGVRGPPEGGPRTPCYYW